MVADIGRIVARSTSSLDERLAGRVVKAADSNDIDGMRIEQGLTAQDTRPLCSAMTRAIVVEIGLGPVGTESGDDYLVE